MMHIRFTSIVLGLLFVAHALRGFYACAHHGNDGKSGEKFSGASEHEFLNIQNHKLEAKTLISANLGSGSNAPRSKEDHFEDTKLKPTRASLADDEPPPKGETQWLLDEAEQEVVNLMNRDYSSPKRFPGKPPITSHGVPKH